MRPKATGTFGWALVGFLCMVIAVGLALVAYSKSIPEYSDPVRAREIRDRDACHDSDCLARWHADMASVRTSKWLYFDTGRNAAAASFALLIFTLISRPWRARRFVDVRTPRWRLLILGLVALSWLALIPAISLSIIEDASRGYFPWWGDSLGIALIPLSENIRYSLPIVLGLIWFFALWRARLPIELWYWDRSRPLRSGAWTLFYAVIVACLLLVLVEESTGSGFLMFPIGITLIYVCLCCRAAVLARPRWFGAKSPPSPVL